DLWFLKKLKKKVFFEFHGSELRSQIYDIFYTYEPRPEDREKQAKQLLKLPKYTDGFILHDEELVPHLPKCDVPVYIVPLRVDLDQFEPEYPVAEKENPIIVHAPSLRSGKGTDNILKVLDQLDAEFTLELVEGKTQQEAFAIYKTADIVIDQISVGSYGVFAIEAMALGKPVITYISDDMRKTFPENLPIVSAIPETLGAKLKKLIENGDYRSTLGKAGRVYVEGYHDYVKNGRLLKDIYEGKGSPIEQR
ncbi:MAG: glycosyltransferase, partial [Anaerovoracaceae bacterium]